MSYSEEVLSFLDMQTCYVERDGKIEKRKCKRFFSTPCTFSNIPKNYLNWISNFNNDCDHECALKLLNDYNGDLAASMSHSLLQ